MSREQAKMATKLQIWAVFVGEKEELSPGAEPGAQPYSENQQHTAKWI